MKPFFLFLCVLRVGWCADIWISDRDSLGSYQTGRIKGSGTESSPFYGDFDAITRSLRAPNHGRLAGGYYYARLVETQNDYQKRSSDCLAPGVKLTGAGRQFTHIIVRARPAKSSVMFYASGDGVELRDFTLDVNSFGTENWYRTGIVLAGSDCVVERVGVKRVYGIAAFDMEAWGIMVGCPEDGRPPARNNRVENCVVEQFMGDYENGIDSGYGSGVVLRGNQIILPDISMTTKGTFRTGHYVGINLSMHTNPLIESNTVINGRDAFYGERRLEGAVLRGNVARGCWHGVRFPRFEPMRDCRFEDNLIVCNPTTAGAVGFAFDSTRGSVFENLDLVRNTIRGNESKPCFPLVLESRVAGVIRNVRFRDNTVNPGSVFKGCEEVRFSGNRSTTGAAITGK